MAGEKRKAGRDVAAIVVTYALALALWTGGLVVLGAVVAPTVFRVVPAPASGDAMTLVFRRFDGVAIADLHRRGAIRGLHEDGVMLEKIHRMAETTAKAELVFLILALALLVVTRLRFHAHPT